MTHLVRTKDATGHVVGEWFNEDADAEAPTAPAGSTFHDVTSLGQPYGSFAGKRWTGSAFEAVASPPLRKLSKYAFLNLFAEAEEAGIEYAAMTLAGGTSEQKLLSAKIRVWQRRMSEASHIDLDDPAVAAQLENLKLILIPTVWADTGTANARIAAILAGEPPS